MDKTVKIAPSILSADFTKLGEQVQQLEKAGADYIHIDVMDGHFVPNLTFGAMIVKQIKPLVKIPLDVHLMVSNPQKHIDSFAEAGADIITFQYESVVHHDRLISYIKSKGVKVGIALNPSTSENSLTYLYKSLDLITVMTVNPGFAGQKFLTSQLNKIKSIKEKFTDNQNLLIEVDGGIDKTTAKSVIAAGANILVAGSAVFSTDDFKTNINQLKDE